MPAIVSFVGNLTRDPVLRESNGNSFYSFSVGVRTRYKDKDGQYKSDFYDCTINSKFGSWFGQNAKKGNSVFVSGEQATRTYNDKNGNERTALTVSVNAIQLTDRPSGKDSGGSRGGQRQAQQQDSDNDLPF